MSSFFHILYWVVICQSNYFSFKGNFLGAAFKIFSIGIHSTSWICDLIFIKFGNFLALTSSNNSLLLLSPFYFHDLCKKQLISWHFTFKYFSLHYLRTKVFSKVFHNLMILLKKFNIDPVYFLTLSSHSNFPKFSSDSLHNIFKSRIW